MTALYGVTHSAETGEPISRLARILKIGIGRPKGPAIHAYINADKKWVIEWFTFPKGGKPGRGEKVFNARAEAEAFYHTERGKVEVAPYPTRLGYFTFLRIGPDGEFIHDFAAIQANGPKPTEIPIVFIDNEPLKQKFEMWTAAELKCHGDGRDAQRRCSMAQTDEEKSLAKAALKEGSQFFPIISGCATYGCPYASGDKPACKPHSRLELQLRGSIALGGTCVYDSTGYRSAKQLFSSLQVIRKVTGRGDEENGVLVGLPLILKLLPYKVSHAGKPSTQHAVSIQMRAVDSMKLLQAMQATADQYRAMMGGKLIDAPAETPIDRLQEKVAETLEAKVMEAEFYPSEPGAFEREVSEEEPAADDKPRPRRKSETDKQPNELRDALMLWTRSGPNRAFVFGGDEIAKTCTLKSPDGIVTGQGETNELAAADALKQMKATQQEVTAK